MNAPQVRAWWASHGSAVLTLAIASMICAALWRMGNELPRLLWDTGGPGAFDLQLRLHEVQRWFAGLPVYGDVWRGDYPPASYVLLWPLLGWSTESGARWIWAITTIGSLAALALIGVRETRAASWRSVLLVGLLPFSVYATSATIRVGQLGNHVVPLLLCGVLLLQRRPVRWRHDLLATAALVGALVKPPLAVPFFWIVCFAPLRIRPIALVCLGYAGISLFATLFQSGDLLAILTGWLAEGPQMSQGHANIHRWLAIAGLHRAALPASVVILALLAWWTYHHRQADVWLLLGVSAIVARFWMHHRLYDDVLILVPMITLLRRAKAGQAYHGSDVIAGILFAATWITLHAPAQLLEFAPPVSTAMEVVQALVWFAVLIFLIRWTSDDAGRPLIRYGSQR